MSPADLLTPWLWHLFAALWGAIWGSFGNVVIHRLPEGMSVVRPSSRCPECGRPIRAVENIPVLSWVLLRGRCRGCGVRIPVRYPLVELGSTLLAVLVMRSLVGGEASSLSMFLSTFFVHFAFLWALLVLSVIDLRTMLLPDAITLPGIVLGLAFTLVAHREMALANALAVVGAYLTVWLVFVVGYRMVAGREGMGMGDAKLLAMIAALLGWKGALFSLVAGALQGLLLNLPFLVRRHEPDGISDEPQGSGDGAQAMRLLRSQVPFGPMLSLAAMEYFFLGDRIIAAYYGLVDSLVARFVY
jgi:leader peptidase (prepilin peptidase)/N-methyltransferase